MDIFRFQYQYNTVYHQWCTLLGRDLSTVKTPEQIPSLPVSFFKQKKVLTGESAPYFFESSGTTQTQNSRHWVRDINLYTQSFTTGFEQFYGSIDEWCILALLPAYLERQHSSLVMMAAELIQMTGHPSSGFYLYNHHELDQTLRALEASGQKTLLLGVTFGLLDFAAAFPQRLTNTVVMETGGMKGRRKEMTRAEVHALLQQQLGVSHIHSEYGMTELLSQAYSKGDGIFECPPWLKVMARDEEDPLGTGQIGKGVLQLIDLANVYSCSFITTEDVGCVFDDGRFEVWGRLDHSDIRGCSLMVL
ncbi:MAG: acyl transferase [Chitinophagaceae bacterium]|nr:acyl transferase [Chitinophagaceae bacterium]